MTRSSKSPGLSHPQGVRPLQDATARFSGLVRRVRSEGPQHVTVRGRDEVVVISADDFRRLQGAREDLTRDLYEPAGGRWRRAEGHRRRRGGGAPAVPVGHAQA
nr:type II toxin-antitoxin system Phd/YefM family antitoxin [Methylobacterium sp. Leaf94]